MGVDKYTTVNRHCEAIEEMNKDSASKERQQVSVTARERGGSTIQS